MVPGLVLYQVDPLLFRDDSGRGWGTLRGITEKLDHLADLGVTTLWLLPFYPSGDRDGGYDVIDHCAIDPRVGDERDFARLVSAARRRGVGVVVELVMQHTSDRHPWFQQARASRHDDRRGYYIWRDAPDPDDDKPMFPPVETTTWRWDPAARQYYRHRFYAHEPDLELADPRVREEMQRIMRYWLERGVAGFRIDALPYMIERAACDDPADEGKWLIDMIRATAEQVRADPILIGEADVGVRAYGEYLAGGRLTHLLDFHLNNHLFLALAREDAADLVRALNEYGADAPPMQRIAWLRNNDELDLEQLTSEERGTVMARFAPLPSMRIYGRGIRRRLAPMLEGSPERIAMAHALILSTGQPVVLRYGDEIGMGDELELPERNAVRTPMQWHGGQGAGFSDGSAPWRAPIDCARYGYRSLNVAAQTGDPDSVLGRVRALLRARRALPELDTAPRILPAVRPHVYMAGFGGDSGVLALVNLSEAPQHVSLPAHCRAVRLEAGRGVEFQDPTHLRLAPYGYGWLRTRGG